MDEIRNTDFIEVFDNALSENECKYIIDYANSNFVNDFSDIFLLANCKAYFGSDTGINAVSDVFSKKVYFSHILLQFL